MATSKLLNQSNFLLGKYSEPQNFTRVCAANLLRILNTVLSDNNNKKFPSLSSNNANNFGRATIRFIDLIIRIRNFLIVWIFLIRRSDFFFKDFADFSFEVRSLILLKKVCPKNFGFHKTLNFGNPLWCIYTKLC